MRRISIINRISIQNVVIMANDHHVTINMSNIPSVSASSSNSRLHGNSGSERNDVHVHHSGPDSDRSNDSHNNRYSSSSANESNLSAYTEDRLSRGATTTEDEDSAHRHHNTHSKLVRDHHKVRFFLLCNSVLYYLNIYFEKIRNAATEIQSWDHMMMILY